MPEGFVDYRLVFLQSSVPMAVASLDGKFTACNDRFVSAFGMSSPRETWERSVFDLATPAHLQRVFAVIGALLRSEEPLPTAEVKGALHDTDRVLTISFIRPKSFVVCLDEPINASATEQPGPSAQSVVFEKPADPERSPQQQERRVVG